MLNSTAFMRSSFRKAGALSAFTTIPAILCIVSSGTALILPVVQIHRDGRVCVALLAPPNVAVSIWGRARVVKEGMDVGEHLVVLEIDVEQVKNDMMRRGAIESAIGFAPPDDLRGFYVGAIAEIEDME